MAGMTSKEDIPLRLRTGNVVLDFGYQTITQDTSPTIL